MRQGELGILEAVGRTPLVELRRVRPRSGRIWVKWEPANPTGSMKDRMAVEVVGAALSDGRLASGDTVVEYTAGTTGVSLAFVCAALGLKLHVVFSDAFSMEKRQTMRAFGASITDESSDEGRITEELIRRMIATAGRISERPGHWWADQLNNEDAVRGYLPLGREIVEQTGGEVDAFVQAVSTAHSIHGTTLGIREEVPSVEVVAVEPAESAVLSGRPTGAHTIEGIGIGFIPPLWRPELVDHIEQVSSAEAAEMSRRLAKEEGIFSGTSTGANVVAAMRTVDRLGDGSRVVTIAVDSGLRYLSTSPYA